LSHIIALRNLIGSDVDRAVIFEDDVIFDKNSLNEIDIIFSRDYVEEHLIHLGGQQGLDSRGYLEGDLIDRSPDVYSIKEHSLKGLYRSVGYIISRTTAKKIVEFVQDQAVCLDDFEYLVKNANIHGVMYSDVVLHPVELSGSAIETEREAKRRLLSFDFQSESLFFVIKKTLINSFSRRHQRMKEKIRGGPFYIPIRKP
jgi:glycosyl transferase family 25